MTATTTLAAAFRALHVPGRPLVLVNAWDAASARIVEAGGASAVATTSAGVAWSLGLPDGGALGREQALEAVARIAAAVEVPVTADVEDGFGAGPAEVAATVGRVREIGAVGVNIEDARAGVLLPTAAAAARVAAAHEAGAGEVFVNVRIDTYLLGVGAPLEETVRRAAAYVEAGADGIFVPGVADPAVIADLVARVDAPLNVMVGPGSPPVAELAALGVARVSVGSEAASAAYGVLRRAVADIAGSGRYDALAGGVSYGELNDLLRAALLRCS